MKWHARLAEILTREEKDVGDIIPAEFAWDFERWQAEITAELANAFEISFNASFDAADPLEAQRLAQEYATQRAGVLVRGITETSRKRLAVLVEGAIRDGWPIGKLQKAISEDMMFALERAKLIATTETATALGQGRKAAAIAQRQNQKRWVTSGDNRVCPTCGGNEEDGWIVLGENFSSGADTIPGHPGCRCDVIHRTTAPEEGVVEEARCPDCNKLCGKHIVPGAQLYCRRCRQEFTVGTVIDGVVTSAASDTPRKMRRTVERSSDGLITALIDEVME